MKYEEAQKMGSVKEYGRKDVYKRQVGDPIKGRNPALAERSVMPWAY